MKMKGIHSTFIVKQNLNYCPKQVLYSILLARHKTRPAGHWVVMKANIFLMWTFSSWFMLTQISTWLTLFQCVGQWCIIKSITARAMRTATVILHLSCYLVPQSLILFMSSCLSSTSTTRHDKVFWHLKISGQQNVAGSN